MQLGEAPKKSSVFLTSTAKASNAMPFNLKSVGASYRQSHRGKKSPNKAAVKSQQTVGFYTSVEALYEDLFSQTAIMKELKEEMDDALHSILKEVDVKVFSQVNADPTLQQLATELKRRWKTVEERIFAEQNVSFNEFKLLEQAETNYWKTLEQNPALWNHVMELLKTFVANRIFLTGSIFDFHYKTETKLTNTNHILLRWIYERLHSNSKHPRHR